MDQPLPRLFVIGSSTTLLFGPYLKAMVAGEYHYARKGDESEQIKLAMANLDVPSGASAGDSNRVLAYLRSLEPSGGLAADVVLIQVGAHDIKRSRSTGQVQVPLDDYCRNVEAIADWLIQRGIATHWLSSGPLDEKIHNAACAAFERREQDMNDYNAALQAILNRKGIPILDLAGYTLRLGPLSETLKDHIHFKDPIVQLQAAYIAGYLHALARRAG